MNYPNSPPTVRFTSEMWHPNGNNYVGPMSILPFVLQIDVWNAADRCIPIHYSILKKPMLAFYEIWKSSVSSEDSS